MEAELKLVNLNPSTGKPFVYIHKEFREMADIDVPTSVTITLRELRAAGKSYGYRCRIKKNDGPVTNDADFASNIGKHGLMQLPPILTMVKRMALEYDEDYECLVIWAYLD